MTPWVPMLLGRPFSDLAAADCSIGRARVGVLGVTFKENVPDVRNSKTLDIVRELNSYSIKPIVHDPLADSATVWKEYAIELLPLEAFTKMNLLILAVSHRAYSDLCAEGICRMIARGGILIDVKSQFSPGDIREDISYWSL